MSSVSKQFKSRIGLIAATVGSAVGLGNIWRFPAEAQANGGAAFLLLYILCVAVLGLPVMLAEFSLGRAGRSDAYGTFRRLAPGTSWWLVGAMGVLASFLIGIFYSVVTGWTLEYLWESVSGGLFDGVPPSRSSVAGGDIFFQDKMNRYIASPWRPIIFTILVVLINMAVLGRSVQKGIERLSNVLMPLLFLVLAGMCIFTLSLPGAGAGVEWFLRPDFSKITATTLINAMGQAFFSLSLGMGILLTYAAYYPDNTRLAKTSGIVAAMSLVVALLVGFVIFPSVASFGLQDHSLAGTTLVFQTLPEVFLCMPCPRLWAILFFVLLFAAALTSTVSIMEVSVAYIGERTGLSRAWSAVVAMSPLLLLSPLCSLSFSSLAHWHICGMTLFDFLDTVTTNLLLPLTSLGICVYLGWFAPKGLLHAQLSNGGTLHSRITGLITFIIRYVAPVLILAIMAAPLVK